MTLSLASTIYDKNGAPILTLFDNSGETGGNPWGPRRAPRRREAGRSGRRYAHDP